VEKFKWKAGSRLLCHYAVTKGFTADLAEYATLKPAPRYLRTLFVYGQLPQAGRQATCGTGEVNMAASQLAGVAQGAVRHLLVQPSLLKNADSNENPSALVIRSLSYSQRPSSPLLPRHPSQAASRHQ
jgi:aspartokinase/homoserine dehydrogenase 1